jgi:hypothetical protein
MLFSYRVVEFRSQADMQRALRKLNESLLDGRVLYMKEVSKKFNSNFWKDTELH